MNLLNPQTKLLSMFNNLAYEINHKYDQLTFAQNLMNKITTRKNQ